MPQTRWDSSTLMSPCRIILSSLFKAWHGG
jgi:hypothetical protein